MWLNEYQKKALSTAVFPKEYAMYYLTLKLNGEAGEVAEKVGKWMRDNPADMPPRSDIAKELGDVLWYIATLADHLGYTLDEIATININKLAGRQAAGTLKGSGDDR